MRAFIVIIMLSLLSACGSTSLAEDEENRRDDRAFNMPKTKYTVTVVDDSCMRGCKPPRPNGY